MKTALSHSWAVLPIMAYMERLPPEKILFFWTGVHKRVGISRVGKSVVLFCNNGNQMHFLSAKQFEKTFWFCELLVF